MNKRKVILLFIGILASVIMAVAAIFAFSWDLVREPDYDHYKKEFGDY